MKTSELIKRIEALGNGLSVELLNKNVVLFADNKQTPICEVHDNIITIHKETFAINSPISNAIESMFGYAYTPLEEREEEKKYLLRVPFTDDLYLNYHKALKSYALSDKYPSKSIQKRFTKEEIDDMPFDTDFFVKEEAK